MKYRLALTVFICAVVGSWAQNPTPLRLLTVEDGRQLVESVPEVHRAKEEYRRPEVGQLATTPDTMKFQARSLMTKGAASGLIGNYEVDRRSGRVWRDIGGRKDENEIRSYLVESLRQQFLNAPQGPLGALNVQSENLLNGIKQKDSIGYTLWGVVLGERLDKGRLPTGTQLDVLAPDAHTGQMISGFRLGQFKMPLVEAYRGTNDSIVEIYVEVAVDRSSFDGLFGTTLTDALLATDAEKWKTMLGSEAIVRRSRFNNIDALFVDAPAKGFSTCNYKRTVAGGTVYVDPIFVDFYIPAQPAKGELLSESAERRMVSCLRDRAVLDAQP